MRAVVGIVIALGLASARVAHAHDVRGEVVLLDVGERVVDAELQVPLGQLALARGETVAQLRAAPIEQLAADARAYVGARAADGRAFAITVRAVGVRRVGDGDVMDVQVRMTAPDGASARWFELRDDLVLRAVVTDNAYVFVRRDLATGEVGADPLFVGLMHYQARALVVDRTAGSAWTGLRAAIGLGIDHIRGGTDHLLFVLMLLVSAPWRARGGRWIAPVPVRRALLRTAAIATAFTLGHSLTLVLGALVRVPVPAAIVEVAIAASILMSAIHALRPLAPGREPILAFGFGLVHGLAFAEALAGFGFDGRSLALALAGFNVGVELMQLAVVALVLPTLVILARGPGGRAVRVAGAAIGVVAAIGWIAERGLGLATPIPARVERLAAHGGWLLAALAAAAVVSWVAQRWGARSRPDDQSASAPRTLLGSRGSTPSGRPPVTALAGS
ncbi:MAG: HupE/UreJ family protein [Deltaproteobacteria bacterium]|nr:HupE/UreJ family protein [Deltaproteobacteria bacterium]